MKTLDFTKYKANAIKNSILRISATFGEFEFTDAKHVTFKNHLFTINKQALKDLSKMMGMAANSLRSIHKTLGKEISIGIYNNMIRAHGHQADYEVLLVITRSGEIVRVLKNHSSVISNNVFFDIAERILDNNRLDIHDLCINPEGELVIQAKGRNTEFQIKGFNDEVFETGLSLSNTHFGVNVDPFMYRLVCSNGMVTKQFDDSITLASNNIRHMNRFFEQLHRMEKRDFQSSGFTHKVKQAIETPASVAEVNQAIKLLMDNSNISLDEVDRFVPYKQTYKDYRNVGVDLEKISAGKKKNARSGIAMWDVINGITDFASHNYGFKVKNAVNIQIASGDMLCKTFDITNTVDACPY